MEINFSQRTLAKTAKKRQARKETMILSLNYAACIENRDDKEENYELRLSGFCVPWQLCEIKIRKLISVAYPELRISDKAITCIFSRKATEENAESAKLYKNFNQEDHSLFVLFRPS